MTLTDEQKKSINELKLQIRNVEKKSTDVILKEEFIVVKEININISKCIKYIMLSFMFMIMFGVFILISEQKNTNIFLMYFSKFSYAATISFALMQIWFIKNYKEVQNDLIFNYMERKKLTDISPIIMVKSLDNGTNLYKEAFVERYKNNEYSETNWKIDTKNKLSYLFRKFAL